MCDCKDNLMARYRGIVTAYCQWVCDMHRTYGPNASHLSFSTYDYETALKRDAMLKAADRMSGLSAEEIDRIFNEVMAEVKRAEEEGRHAA